MRLIKYICLTVAIVLFTVDIFLENTTVQLIVMLAAFAFFEIWIYFVKNDRKHHGH